MGSSAMYTGNDLLPFCADELGGYKFNSCLDFIRGANDGHDVISALHKLDSYYCLPDGVTAFQAAKVVRKYLENHPENLHVMAVGLVYAALRSAFPCEDDQ
jgi:hypothetical protein